MHTLLDGLVSAIIGALVALAVVFWTVRAQNAGIAEQLRTQSRENIRSREHAAAAELLRTLRAIQDTAGRSRVSKDAEGKKDTNVPAIRSELQPLYAELRIGLERLRLDLKDEDDDVIDSFGTWTRDLEHRIWFYMELQDSYVDNPPEKRPPGTQFVDLREQMVSILSTVELMTRQIVAYVRADDEARQGTTALLNEARAFAADVQSGKKSQVDYYNKYLRRSDDPA
ncbi:hypothetical protein [Paenarthrobacter sp. A20]|uniref:hypothetical protein n=1 Tax=Paenarthrobacter sp. A20 TaxID=2817891 RepID=UPI0020A213D6|nr:hypothetical protein [Paenarthrobacter sp. A20]MCP1415655.1 hypothetical protein [Paenarthrobacter sp. A20]